MLKINIDDTYFQEFSVPFEGDYIYITLNFRVDNWYLNLKYKDKKVNGLKLSSSVLMLSGMNLPFDIIINDKGVGLDPFKNDSFSSGFFEFLLFEREDLEELRGYKVK